MSVYKSTKAFPVGPSAFAFACVKYKSTEAFSKDACACVREIPILRYPASRRKREE